MSLRKKIIRLAYEKPELRKDLLPLVKTALSINNKRDAQRWVEDTFGSVGRDLFVAKYEETEQVGFQDLFWFKCFIAIQVESSNSGTMSYGDYSSIHMDRRRTNERNVVKALVELGKSDGGGVKFQVDGYKWKPQQDDTTVNGYIMIGVFQTK